MGSCDTQLVLMRFSLSLRKILIPSALEKERMNKGMHTNIMNINMHHHNIHMNGLLSSNQLCVNISNCYMMIIAASVRSKTSSCQKSLTLDGHLISTVPEMKILGLIFSNDLK